MEDGSYHALTGRHSPLEAHKWSCIRSCVLALLSQRLYIDTVLNSTEAITLADQNVALMDFTVLKMKSSSRRFPMLALIRDEWRLLVNLQAEGVKGLRGSVIMTGQPGISEQGLLHFR